MNDGEMRCPVCNVAGALHQHVAGADRCILTCKNCGEHLFSGSAYASLVQLTGRAEDQARVAYAVRTIPRDALISSNVLQSIMREAKLPPALERIDNVIQFVAEAREPGEPILMYPVWMTASVGATTETAAHWAIRQAISQGFLDGRDTSSGSFQDCQLTPRGWTRYAELTRDAAGSRHAFMAMKFGDPQLDDLFRSHLKPAVEETGFELRRLDGSHATAGSIDNRMRVELRTSRFVVCDLTHANLGAYWEAGFAEGLGRPVFYICRQDQDGDRFTFAGRPHFDVNHQLIIPWRADDPAAGMQQLKDAIRATLPSEARMEDA